MTTNYFKNYGKAAELASMRYTLNKALDKTKTEAEEDAIRDKFHSYVEKCTWRDTYTTEIKGRTVQTGFELYKAISFSVDKKFRYITFDEFFWNEQEAIHFLSLLDELNIKEFVYTNTSTAVMDNLISFLNNGWKVARAIKQEHDHYGRVKVEEGLLIKKVKKN